MAENGLSDTNEKILMKDHDILIALHTQNSELIRRVDLLSAQLQDNQKSTYSEFKAVAVSQAKLEGDVLALQNDMLEASKRMDKMDLHWKRGDIAILIGTIIAGVIAWFR